MVKIGSNVQNIPPKNTTIKSNSTTKKSNSTSKKTSNYKKKYNDLKDQFDLLESRFITIQQQISDVISGSYYEKLFLKYNETICYCADSFLSSYGNKKNKESRRKCKMVKQMKQELNL